MKWKISETGTHSDRLACVTAKQNYEKEIKTSVLHRRWKITTGQKPE